MLVNDSAQNIVIVAVLFGLGYLLHHHHHRHHHDHAMDHHDHGAVHGMDGGGDMDGGMMPMYFMNGIKTILWLKGWATTSLFGYVAALLGLVAFGVAHEALACWRANYHARLSRAAQRAASGLLDGGGGGESSSDAAAASVAYGRSPPTPLAQKLTLAAFYVGNAATGYLLMLAVMTYNVGVFAAVLLGLGAGFLLCYDAYPAKKATVPHSFTSDCCDVRLLQD